VASVTSTLPPPPTSPLFPYTTLFRSRGPDDQQLPAAGARLRGADQPDLLAAQPVSDLSHSGVFQVAQGQARRVPGARSVVEPVPHVRGTAHGGTRRYQAQDRAAEADGCGLVRPRARGAQACEEHAGLPERVVGGPRGRPRLPARGWSVHARPDRALAR